MNKLLKKGEVLEHFLKYIDWQKARPFLVKDWVGKDGDMVHREKERPLSMNTFKMYLHVHGILANIREYAANKDGVYDDFVEEFEIIDCYIKGDQIDGGMVGIYNHSITARLNNLSDSVDVTSSVSILNIDPLDE